MNNLVVLDDLEIVNNEKIVNVIKNYEIYNLIFILHDRSKKKISEDFSDIFTNKLNILDSHIKVFEPELEYKDVYEVTYTDLLLLDSKLFIDKEKTDFLEYLKESLNIRMKVNYKQKLTVLYCKDYDDDLELFSTFIKKEKNTQKNYWMNESIRIIEITKR